MAKSDEKRVLTAIRKTDGRKKCLLLVNNITEECLRGTPLLTESEIDDITRDIRANVTGDMRGDVAKGGNRRECAAMLDALHLLSLCLLDVQTESLDVKAEVAYLQSLFALMNEYQNFGAFLNELCWMRSGKHSERLQKRAVFIGQLFPYFYNISVKEEGDGMKLIDLKVPDEGSAAIFEVIERVKQKSSGLKALIQAMRDFMSQKRIPFSVIIEKIDDFEQETRERIHVTKSLLYRTDFAGWEELRATLVQSANPKLAMMEALPDYDDLSADQVVYDEKRFLLNGESPFALLRVQG